MIDLTPLDVRNKRGDFKKLLRGYDPQEVDVFLELVADRLEALVRENLHFRERMQTLQEQVTSQLGREQAVQDALVTAQELRADVKAQALREAEHTVKEGKTEARRLVAEAQAEARTKLRDTERRIDGAADALMELERRRDRFLKDFRRLLEREFEVVDVEIGRTPLEDTTIDLDLGRPFRPAERGEEGSAEPASEAPALPAESVVTQEGDAGDASREAERGRSTLSQGARAPEPSVEGLSSSFEAEAVAEAQTQAVEVTDNGHDDLAAVPGLEEVLAEAGAEFADAMPGVGSAAPQEGDEISPPPTAGPDDETFLLYLDSDESEK